MIQQHRLWFCVFINKISFYSLSMAHYKGAASEGNRAATLLKKREQAKEEFEFMKKRISEVCLNNAHHKSIVTFVTPQKGHAARFENITSKFSSTYDAVEEQLKSSTIGSTHMYVFYQILLLWLFKALLL